MRRITALRLTALALSVTSVAGCNVSQLQFTNDKRLTFNAPQERAKVKVPFTVSWSMKDFTATGLDGSKDKHQGVFAVFLDSAPMPVGKDIKWLVRGDISCKRDPRCPDKAYLASKYITITQDPSVTIDTLPQASGSAGDEEHYVNVVLLDGTGHRIGESAWYRAFKSARRSS